MTVRLLTRERLATLARRRPFCEAIKTHDSGSLCPHFHDRYVFVDNNGCYQSGASFKDGAKSAPTTLTQITDAFAAMMQTYEDIWSKAKVER